MTLSELEELCVSAFDEGREHWQDMFERFRLYIEDIADLGVDIPLLWVDGSFLTKKPRPADIDMVVILNRHDVQQLDDRKVEQAQELLHGGFVVDRKERYAVDAFLVYQDREDALALYEKRFGTARDGETEKGIALIQPVL